MPGRRQQHARHSRHRPKPDREQLRRYFVGTEGIGERAFARWIASLCAEAGPKIWFDIPGAAVGGGSTLHQLCADRDPCILPLALFLRHS